MSDNRKLVKSILDFYGYQDANNGWIKCNTNYQKLKNIPIIALTVSVMGTDLQMIKEYNFDGYLIKLDAD